MKVLLTTDTIGGVWTYALELAASLGRRGVAVSIAASGGRLSPEQRRAVRRLSNLQVFESDFKLEWMPDALDDVAAAGEWLLGLADGLKPDVVHLNSYSHAALPWLAP